VVLVIAMTNAYIYKSNFNPYLYIHFARRVPAPGWIFNVL